MVAMNASDLPGQGERWRQGEAQPDEEAVGHGLGKSAGEQREARVAHGARERAGEDDAAGAVAIRQPGERKAERARDEAKLHGVVAVFAILGFDLEDTIRTGENDGDGDDVAVLIVNASVAEFLSE